MKNSNYYLALTIEERINSFKRNNIELETDEVFLDRWINIRGLSNIKDTQEICNMKGIKLKEFIYALKNFDEYEKKILCEQTLESKWYKKIEEVIEYYKNSKNKLEELNSTIYYPVRPFILYSIYKIIENTKNFKNINVSLKVWDRITEFISYSLSDIIIKIITLGLHEYKNKYNHNQSNDLFREYMTDNFEKVQQLEDFYNEYPTMTRLLVEKMQYLIQHINNIFERIESNYLWVQKIVDCEKIIISNIELGEGDTHSSGQNVSIIEFENNKKIVYKPKNLIIEQKFNKLLDWINDTAYQEIEEMKYVQSIYFEKYTLTEYVDAKQCENEDDVKLYYKRLGQLLFILYSLNGNDFHFENIISSCGQPYLIDIETVFQVAMTDILVNANTAEGLIYKKYNNSVLSIGILPLLGFEQNSEGKSVDISALNGLKQKLPFKVLSLKNVNTQDMIFDYDYPELSESNNLPVFKNEKQLYHKYKNSLVCGFNNMSKFILFNKEKYVKIIKELFNDNNIIVRQLTKATASYSTLLQYRNHPNYLKDMIYMERLFENLMAYPYNDKKIVLSEMKDMIFGDIPIFFSKLTSNDIICSDGKTIENYFLDKPLDRVVNKINSLNESNIEEQLWMLLNSVGTEKEEKIKLIDEINNKIEEENTKVNLNSSIHLDELHKMIEEINIKITSQIVYGNDKEDLSWVNYKIGNIKYEPVDYSLEAGITGIAMYFYFLNKVYNKNEYFKNFDLIVKKMGKLSKKMYENSLEQLPNILLFSLCKENSLSDYSGYLDYVVSVADKLISGEIKYERNDVNVIVKCLLAYYKKENEIELLKRARKLFNSFKDDKEISDEEIFFMTDKKLLLFDEQRDEVIYKMKKYADGIISQNVLEVWKKSKVDTVSNGLLNIVNNLIDIFNITDERKYIDYALNLLAISINSYKNKKMFRLLSSNDYLNVALDDGYCGLVYTILRAYIDNELPNIFNLNII